MQRESILTEDGSCSLYAPQFHQSYHSVHGAMQESEHIYIRAGLQCEQLANEPAINIFEMGFGTGLNALLTWYYAPHVQVNYESVELYPLQPQEYASLNYAEKIPHASAGEVFRLMHSAAWNTWQEISSNFHLYKYLCDLQCLELHQNTFHLVYFDAFSPDKQPELWSNQVFERIFLAMRPQGVLVTYSTKGDVKRALRSAGFCIEKLPGPVGKREILRAYK